MVYGVYTFLGLFYALRYGVNILRLANFYYKCEKQLYTKFHVGDVYYMANLAFIYRLLLSFFSQTYLAVRRI